MQFQSENRLNRCQIFRWFGLKKPNFGFLHIANGQTLEVFLATGQ